MAADTQSVKIIMRWLERLANITKATTEGAMSAEKIADLALMLAKEFPSAAFTSDSLQAVCAEIEWFPAYSTLRAAVAIWWGDHRPRTRQLTGPAGAEDLGIIDQRWFAFWHTRCAEISAGRGEDEFGHPRNPYAGRGSAEAARANLAGLMRLKSPAAWALISGDDGSRPVPTDADRAAVAESARAAIQALAEHRSGSPATASIGEQLAAVRSAMGAGFRPKELTPEQLAAARASLVPRSPADWVLE
jgi:hypothetical protein